MSCTPGRSRIVPIESWKNLTWSIDKLQQATSFSLEAFWLYENSSQQCLSGLLSKAKLQFVLKERRSGGSCDVLSHRCVGNEDCRTHCRTKFSWTQDAAALYYICVCVYIYINIIYKTYLQASSAVKGYFILKHQTQLFVACSPWESDLVLYRWNYCIFLRAFLYSSLFFSFPYRRVLWSKLRNPTQ